MCTCIVLLKHVLLVTKEIWQYVELNNFVDVSLCIDTLSPSLSNILKEGRKEMFYITTHSTHFIYGYMASDICHHPTDRTHSNTSRGAPAGTRNSSMGSPR